MSNMPSFPVVISGMGIICSLGYSIEQFSEALLMGKSGIAAVDKTDLPIKVAALLRDFDFACVLNTITEEPLLRERAQEAAQRAPMVVQTAVCSALQAWIQAGLLNAKVAPHRIGIVVAGQNLNTRYSYDMYHKHQQDLEYVPPNYGLHFLDTNLVGVLSEIFQTHGQGFSVGGASASGNVGIIQGCQLIQSGTADICLVVGAMADLSPLELQAWHNLGALGGSTLKPEHSCRPFDQSHEGFIYGQGCGCLVLEHKASIERRSATVLATVAGHGFYLDGNRLSHPNQAGEVAAIKQALQMAGMSPADITYINTHGTSSALGDDTEIAAINEVFENHLNKIWINATKALTGHCLYAAGVVEAIATVLQMQKGFVHPNVNLDNPTHPQMRFVGKKAQNVIIPAALSNSFGFGGINSSIVLGREKNHS